MKGRGPGGSREEGRECPVKEGPQKGKKVHGKVGEKGEKGRGEGEGEEGPGRRGGGSRPKEFPSNCNVH